VGHPAATVLPGREGAVQGGGLSAHADGQPAGPLPATSSCVPGAPRIVGSGGG
jgi:diacylglycerol kinase (ATP)